METTEARTVAELRAKEGLPLLCNFEKKSGSEEAVLVYRASPTNPKEAEFLELGNGTSVNRRKAVIVWSISYDGLRFSPDGTVILSWEGRTAHAYSPQDTQYAEAERLARRVV